MILLKNVIRHAGRQGFNDTQLWYTRRLNDINDLRAIIDRANSFLLPTNELLVRAKVFTHKCTHIRVKYFQIDVIRIDNL